MNKLRIALLGTAAAGVLGYAFAQTPAGAPFFQTLSVQGISTFNGLATFNGNYYPNSVYPCPVATTLATCVANAPGGATIMLDGNTTYTVSAFINVTKFNTTIACQGWNTVIKRSNTLNGVMLQFSGVGGTLRDCAVDGNGIVNNTVVGADVALSGVGAGAFHNSIINSHGNSISLSGDYDWVRGNKIVGMGPTDPTLQTYGVWAIFGNKGISITDNKIQDTGIDAIGVNGIGTVVANNYIINCHCLSSGPLNTGGGVIATYPGVTLTVSAATWAANAVTFTTTANHGLATGGEFIVSGMTPATWNGVYVVTSAPNNTTLVAAQTVNPGNATVMGTIVPDKGTSIVIDGNTIDQGCSYNSVGIEINSRHTVVSNNTVRNQKSFSTGFDQQAAYVDFTGNHISNGNQTTTFYPPQHDVIIKTGVQHITINGGEYTDDQLTHTSPYAVGIQAGADFITMNGLDVTGHVFGAVHNESNGQNIKFGTSNLTDYVVATPTAGRLYAEPFWVSSTPVGLTTITKLSAQIAATTGGSVRFGIYADNTAPIPSSPGNRLYDSGILSIPAAGTLSTGAIAINQGCATNLTGCYIWIVSAWSSTATPSVLSLPVQAGNIGYRGQFSNVYSDATLATALPANFGAITYGTAPVPAVSINDGGIGVLH